MIESKRTNGVNREYTLENVIHVVEKQDINVNYFSNNFFFII